ncbi:hypothetical protein FUSO7_09655 [Fusobacterium necrophorum BFTR-2]|nr:hypothetical protein [Fusobacterium necrophorum]KDE71724.1 hypothetical protein FUSO7_09655 [Fusobacterium necrophorum BFTR-2]
MKKLLVVLVGLLVFQVSFAKWSKIYQDDDFGDKTTTYMIAEEFNEIPGLLLIGYHEETKQEAVAIQFLGLDLGEGIVYMKAKGDKGEIQPAPKGFASGAYIAFYESEGRKIINLLKTSSVVKFNIDGMKFSISARGFLKMYDAGIKKKFKD